MSYSIEMSEYGESLMSLLLLDFITKRLTQFQWMQQMYTLMEMIWETLQVR